MIKQILTFVLIAALGATAQANPPQKSILLLNGTAHIGNGKVIEKSAIGIKDGKIMLVADASSNPDKKGYDEVIDISGKHVYPGFIAPNSTIGLREIDAVRATLDYAETGSINPNVRSLIAYNTDSKIIPTLRYNGILLAQATPRRGLITGTSSVMAMDGWNWEDAVYKEDDGVHMNWPSMFVSKGWWAEPGPIEANKEREKQLNELKSFFREAKAYNELSAPTEKNLRFEAMRGVFNGSKNLYVNASFAKEITEVVNFAKEMGVSKLVIIGGNDSWMVTDLLKENNVAVIVNRVHDLPARMDDDIDLPFKLPALLQKAGVLYALNYEGDMEVMGARNLPFTAGTAVAFGLDKEEAVKAITLNPAKILGVDDKVGSLETGKDATLFVSTGDALDMRTNNVELVLIRGKKSSLENHQNELYNKYKKKYQSEK